MGTTSLHDFQSRSMWRAVTAEILGTCFLVLLGCGSCLHGIGNVGIALCFGFTIVAIVWAIADVSGGHINPAVTLAFFVTRRISFVRTVLYIVAQVSGALLGAGILHAITPPGIRSTLGSPSLSADVTTGQGFGVEFLITFIFVFVIFSAVDSQRRDSAPATVVIGFALLACHLWAVPITGAGMNPARSFGPAVISRTWKNHWVYWVGPLAGGVCAGLLYDLLYAGNASGAKFWGYFTLNYDEQIYERKDKRLSECFEEETRQLRSRMNPQ